MIDETWGGVAVGLGWATAIYDFEVY